MTQRKARPGARRGRRDHTLTQLLLLARKNDRHAFYQFVQRVQKTIFDRARERLGDEKNADDLGVAATITMLYRLEFFDPAREPARAWARAIVDELIDSWKFEPKHARSFGEW